MRMERPAPARSRRAARTPGTETLDLAYNRFKATMAKYRDQDGAERVRKDVAVIMIALEREAARWIGTTEGMADDWVFGILQEEEAGEYEMQMPRTRPSA